MFDFSLAEFLIVIVVALVVIGPKDLPRSLYILGRWIAKIRGWTSEFQYHINEMIHDAEFEEFSRRAKEFHRKNFAQFIEHSIDSNDRICDYHDTHNIDPGRRINHSHDIQKRHTNIFDDEKPEIKEPTIEASRNKDKMHSKV